MLVSEAVEEYRYYILKHSPATQVWYMARLTTFAAWCESHGLQLEQIKPIEIRRYIEELRTKTSDRPHFFDFAAHTGSMLNLSMKPRKTLHLVLRNLVKITSKPPNIG